MAAGFLAIILVLIIARFANTYNVHNLYRTSDAGLQAQHSYVRTLETGFVATGLEPTTYGFSICESACKKGSGAVLMRG